MEVEETSDKSQKRVKMRDLESVFRSEGMAITNFSWSFTVLFGLWQCIFLNYLFKDLSFTFDIQAMTFQLAAYESWIIFALKESQGSD